MGFGVDGVECVRFRDAGLGFGIYGGQCRVWGVGCMVQDQF